MTLPSISPASAAPRVVACGTAGAGKSTLAARCRAAGEGACTVDEAPDDALDARVLVDTASAAGAALFVVDAGQGLSSESRRQLRILALLGVAQLLVAVNKMDLAGFARPAFATAESALRAFASTLGFAQIDVVPVCALAGDNVAERGVNLPWYGGPTLIDCLQRHMASRPVEPAGMGPKTVDAVIGRAPDMADQFEARLLWTAGRPLLPGRSYRFRLDATEVAATVTGIKYREDADTGARMAAKALQKNEMALVNLSLERPVVFEPGRVNRTLGVFTLIDPQGLDTVGVGSIVFALRRASNIRWQALAVDKGRRAAALKQTPLCIWFTGLSGAGKSTLASLLEKRLHAAGWHTYVLDGDNVRHGLCRDLGFTEVDRIENIRRVAECARLMLDAGLVVLVSLISPYRADRAMARGLFGAGEFLEVYVDTPLAECERRDTKGLYAKARRGELRNFTGIDSPYEPPLAPDMHLRTEATEAQLLVDGMARRLLKRR